MVREKSRPTCLLLVCALALGGCSVTTTSELEGAAQLDDLAERSELALQGNGAPLVNDNDSPRTFREDALHPEKAPEVMTIGNERGGYVVAYAMRVHKLQENNAAVRFTGRCESACTLYLALPQDQTCIAHGASFRFHAPRASTQRASRAAEAYMLKTYPEWVTAWIDARGGLSDNLMTMDYSYASQHLRPCGAIAGGGAPRSQMSRTADRPNVPIALN